MRSPKCPDCGLFGIRVALDNPTLFTCKYCDFTAYIPQDADALQRLREAQSDRLAIAKQRTKLARVYLTDGAYSWHVQMAHDLGYVRATYKANGLFRYVAALATLDYVDARPAYLRGTPVWYTSTTPTPRRVKLQDSVVDLLWRTASKHGIAPYRYQRYAAEGFAPKTPSPVYDGYSYCGPLLEAIGLCYLVPHPDTPIPRSTHTWASKQQTSRTRPVIAY